MSRFQPCEGLARSLHALVPYSGESRNDVSGVIRILESLAGRDSTTNYLYPRSCVTRDSQILSAPPESVFGDFTAAKAFPNLCKLILDTLTSWAYGATVIIGRKHKPHRQQANASKPWRGSSKRGRGKMGQDASSPVDESTPPQTLESRTLDGVAKYIKSGGAQRIVVMVSIPSRSSPQALALAIPRGPYCIIP